MLPQATYVNPNEPVVTKEDKVKMVSLFNKRITYNAYLTLLAGLVMSLTFAFTIPHGVFIGLYILLMFTLLAYNVNCVQVGHCSMWAWILTAVYVIYAVIVVAFLIFKKDTVVANIAKKLKK